MSIAAADRKRNRTMQGAVRPLGRQLKQRQTVEDMWPLVIQAAVALGAAAVRLHVGAPGQREVRSFSQPPDNGESIESPWFQFPIPAGKALECRIELGWTDGRQGVDPDTEVAVDILCEYLGEALELARTPPAPPRRRPGIEPQA